MSDPFAKVDDEVYFCKKCNNILEEGRAFELGGNRWHIECFRCSNCDSQLDCDTNLLVLGNGDLICGACCYSCCVCGKKIDDLAILTGKDSAFCAKCFKCRNCKRPIENLRYARTSQGIFCMSCHEKLVEKRRRNKLKSALDTADTTQLMSEKLLSEKSSDLLKQAVRDKTAMPDEVRLPSPDMFDRLRATRTPSPQLLDKLLPPVPLTRSANANEATSITDSTATVMQSIPATLKDEEYESGNKSLIQSSSDMVTVNHARASIIDQVHSAVSHSPMKRVETGTKVLDECSNAVIPSNSKSGLPIYKQMINTIATQELDGSPQNASVDATIDESTPSLVSAASDIEKLSVSSLRTDISFPPRDDSHHAMSCPPQSDSPILAGSTSLKVDKSSGVAKDRSAPPADTSAKYQELSNGPNNSRTRENTEELKRSHSITINQNKLDSTTSRITTGHASHPKRSPFMFSVPFGSKKDKQIIASVLQDSETAKTSSFVSSSSEKAATSLMSSPPKTPKREREITADSPRDQNMSLPVFRGNTGFNLEEDFATILNDQQLTSSPRSPQQTSSHRTNHLQSLLRKPSRSTLRNFVTGGSSPSHTDAKDGNASPLSSKKVQMSPYMANGDSPSSRLTTRGEHGSMGSIHAANESLYKLLHPPADGNDVAKLKYELAQASARILNLESKVVSSDFPNQKYLDDNINQRRTVLAELDSRIVVSKGELAALSAAKASQVEAKSDYGNEFSARYDEEMSSSKTVFVEEINSLVSERNCLIEDNLRLSHLKNEYARQVESLINKKHELEKVTASLNKQVQEGFRQHKESPSVGSNMSVDGLLSQPLAELPGDGSMSLGTTGRQSRQNQFGDSMNTVATDELQPVEPSSREGEFSGLPAGTSRFPSGLEASAFISSESNALAGAKKRFWQRKGEIVAKGAVRGFNRMFTYDGPDSLSRSAADQSGAGLNIIMPREEMVSSGVDEGKSNFGMKVKASTFAKGGDSSSEENGMTGTGLFGVDITVRTRYEKRQVPFIVSRCIQEVEQRGMACEGIYRKSGMKSQSDSLQRVFEHYRIARSGTAAYEAPPNAVQFTPKSSNSSVETYYEHEMSNESLIGVILTPESIKSEDEFKEAMQGDICGITSTLKQYLRCLPVPLITYDSYMQFIGTCDQAAFEDRLRILMQVMRALPLAHRVCLEYLVRHLSRVVAQCDQNLMTPLNLAVVFAPTLARDVTGEREMMDARKRSAAVQFMIENVDRVFAKD
ncbi:hypothetical protein V1512DRAFT_84194 [Lipomyces arxii]|uniref:uncharacterized protein n=1 Tax=Lipomyces arxii TaxID=56418 RepID=UPI0034CE29F0